jgi:uncharacterized iron-regulated membrane protein
MLWETLTRRPRELPMRKVLFQVHLWMGIGVGLYVLLISITGSALVLREEVEILLYPQLFKHEGPVSGRATSAMVLNLVQPSYPDFTISAIYSPTGKRDTFMLYINKNGDYRTVYADPVTGEALGEVPAESFIGWVQDLHFNLLAGSTGRLLNGLGGFALVVLGISGLVIWWPGVSSWKRGLTIDLDKSWKRINWELHGAAGIWLLVLILMWGVTGAYFTFPQQYASIIEALSPTTPFTPPMSNIALESSNNAPPDIDALASRAVDLSEGRELWAVDFPPTDGGSIQVVTAKILRDRWANQDHREFYFDQFSGDLLAERTPVVQTPGDLVMEWIVPLHFGTFAGLGVKILWVVLALAPALLFVTGSIIWWNRVLRDRWT